eukprot:4720098-Karenia_brevis.AAC.1
MARCLEWAAVYKAFECHPEVLPGDCGQGWQPSKTYSALPAASVSDRIDTFFDTPPDGSTSTCLVTCATHNAQTMLQDCKKHVPKWQEIENVVLITAGLQLRMVVNMGSNFGSMLTCHSDTFTAVHFI